nr:hypothetical protein BaRGS_006298 [Batillaria attramentaria]
MIRLLSLLLISIGFVRCHEPLSRQQLTEELERLRSQFDQFLKNQKPPPIAVAFTARFSGDNIAVANHATLKLDRVITNIGNGYDPVTGIFTAPVAGVYGFYATLMAANGHGQIYLAIDKHGSILDIIHGDGNANINDQGSTLMTTHLAAGEKVWMRHYKGSIVRGSWWTIFTGYLIQAD